MREREGVLKRLEERLGRMSGWLGARRGPGEAAGAPERMEALRREIARLRQAAAARARLDLEHARAALDDMKRDYAVEQPHLAFGRGEREAFRQHLKTTARLLPDLSNVDSPGFDRAEEEYERSWEELSRAFEAGDHRPSP